MLRARFFEVVFWQPARPSAPGAALLSHPARPLRTQICCLIAVSWNALLRKPQVGTLTHTLKGCY